MCDLFPPAAAMHLRGAGQNDTLAEIDCHRLPEELGGLLRLPAGGEAKKLVMKGVVHR